MSKITAIAYKHNVLTLKLNDGSIFLTSTKDPQQKCNWSGVRTWNYKFFDSVLLSFDGDVIKIDAVTIYQESDVRIDYNEIIRKLPDGNLESCATNWRADVNSKFSEAHQEVGCWTIFKDSDIGDFDRWDFYINHEAYRLDGCTLVVTHNNCTDFFY